MSAAVLNTAVLAPSQTAAFPVIFSEDEPRIGHFDLAERLGHIDRRAASRIVQRNRAELRGYGLVGQRVHPIRTGKGRIQRVTEYLLNEPQAILVCIFAQTPKAAEVRKLLIETFLSARQVQRRSARAITVKAPARPSQARVDHRKRAFAGAVARLMDAGVDYRDFDHDRVTAFADGLRKVSEAF
jgi:hypothetical protein